MDAGGSNGGIWPTVKGAADETAATAAKPAKQKANAKRAEDESNAAAEKAAELATVYEAKSAEFLH